MHSSDINAIIEKLREHLAKKYNKKIYNRDIAKELGITKEHLSRIKQQNKIPLEAIVNFCAKEKLLINYILFNQIPTCGI